MDISTVAISIISSSIVSSIAVGLFPKLWDWWRESAKIKKEEKKLLNLLLYQFTALHDAGASLGEQFAEHLDSPSFITDYADPYIDNLYVIYQQIEATLQELAKLDPSTAAGLRHSHYNNASYHLFILKKFLASAKEWKKDLSKDNLIRELKSNRRNIDDSSVMIVKAAKISMYIIASRIDKEALKNLSSTHPDKQLMAEFMKS